MKASILSKLDHLSERYEEVGALLSDGDIISDQNRFRALSKEYAELEPLVKTYASYNDVVENIDEAKLLLKDSDTDMREMAQEEMRSGEAARQVLELEMQKLLLPKDPKDSKNVFLKFVPEPVAMKRRFFPVTYSVCTADTRKPSAGRLRLSVRTAATTVATKK